MGIDIVGNRRYVEVPGDKTHELPPLLVRTGVRLKRLDQVMLMANEVIDREEIIGPPPINTGLAKAALEMERRKMDMAINLTQQYLTFVMHWRWGNDVLEWIRQCETTFGTRMDLLPLLRPDVWPHAGRASFVRLLEDKEVDTGNVILEKAVGLRLTFHRPPPLKCFSDQFLLYLKDTVANTAYSTWAGLSKPPLSSLPPERFNFQVVNMSLE